MVTRRRKQQRTPDALLVADLHLREDTPTCRTDDYREAQHSKLKWLLEMRQRYACPLLIAGDVFNKPRPSCDLLREVIELVWDHSDIEDEGTCNIFAVPGQHDLPYHSDKNYFTCGLSVLAAAGCVEVLNNETEPVFLPKYSIRGFGWGKDLDEQAPCVSEGLPAVAMVHRLCWKGKAPFPGAPKEGNVRQMREALETYQLVLCGDNHQQFVDGSRVQWLVNPGSFMRMTADQMEHEPAVYAWHIAEREVERIPVPIVLGVISREHIEKKRKHDKRIEAFVEKLGGRAEVSFSFENNLREYLEGKRVRKGVKDIVWKAVGG